MANFCKQCSKKIGFLTDGYYLNDTDMLCDDCAEKVRGKTSELFGASSENEFLEIADELIQVAKDNFNEDVVEAFVEKIERAAKKRNYKSIACEKTESPKGRSNANSTNAHTPSNPENRDFYSGMFSNIGSKIKALATVCTWVGIILSFIAGIVLISMDEQLIFPGLLIMIGGSLLSWLSSFILYGFGQLVENSDKTVELLKDQKKD